MNTNDKIAKIRRWAGIAAKVLRVVQVLIVAVTVIVCLLVVLHYFGIAPEGFNATFKVSSLGIAPIVLTPDGVSGHVLAVTILSLLMALQWALYFAIFQIVRHMMLDISAHETPFEHIQVKRMRRIALLILLSSFTTLSRLGVGEWITALVLWFLSIVFDYGCLLQQESDETL